MYVCLMSKKFCYAKTNFMYRSQSKRDHFAYYASQPKEEIGMMALRYKNFKAHFYTKGIKSTLKRYYAR